MEQRPQQAPETTSDSKKVDTGYNEDGSLNPQAPDTPEQMVTTSKKIAQVYLFSKYFEDEKGGKIGILEPDTLIWLIERYGEAFNDFLVARPEIAKQIVSNMGNIDTLNPYDINEMVLYMKTHITNSPQNMVEH